ncbi:MAG TPA: hydroxyacid dehydrogenase, partial [Clostridia bacterium]
MRGKILVTPRSFGAADPTVFDTLAAAGLEILRNPDGAILTEERMIRLAADCDGLILGVDPLTSAVLDAAPRLRAVAKYGVGLDNVDLEACRLRGVRVSTTIGANTE